MRPTSPQLSHVAPDPIPWLLEPDNPSVRYFALTGLLGRGEANREVIEAKRDIMQTGPVPRILGKQAEGGYWGIPDDFYIRSKYKGTVWNLIVLAELGADGRDERVRKACEFILDWSQDRQSGGFAYRRAKDGRGGDHGCIIPCLTGNMVWCLLRFGYLKDPWVQRGIDWIARFQRHDDGVAQSPKGWPYDGKDKCYGKHTCHMGVAKALKALAEVSESQRTAEVKAAIAAGAEYLLAHRIYEKSHDPGKVANPRWLEFGFPLMWDMDVLEVLLTLLKLGYLDERMRDAVELIAAKQDSEGRWTMKRSFNGRLAVRIERDGKPNKWVTLRALTALKAFEEG